MALDKNAVEMTHDTLTIVHTKEFGWVPWAMPGTWFKLLHAEERSGRFTILIKVDPGNKAPTHRHIKAVEVYILEGGFFYTDDPNIRFDVDSYLYEHDAAIHKPESPLGCIMFAVFHGPLEGVAEDGKTSLGQLDAKWHIDKWAELHT